MPTLLKKTIIVFIFITSCTAAQADKLKTGFERLKIYDYFKAKALFEKTIRSKTAGAAFGLSIIYSLNNNPFYNLDSARKYVLLSDSAFQLCSAKQKGYFLQLGVNDLTIQAQKDSICNKAFRQVEWSASVEAFNGYMLHYAFCGRQIELVLMRNALAYKKTQIINTAAAYRNFIKDYPQSAEADEALKKLNERLFIENTSDGQLDSYIRFLDDFPQSPYRKEAEKAIYVLSTPDKSIEQLHDFVKKYPSNIYTEEAWRLIYKKYMKDFDESVYDNFKRLFPDYPYKDELQADYQLFKAFYIPVIIDNKFGYINENGTVKIKGQFDDAGYFNEGLAAVERKEKFGFIDKSGRVAIDFQFDDAEAFAGNCAVVRLGQFYGLINRRGEYIIKPQYSELSEPVEGICLALQNELWGFVSKDGHVISECKFDYAETFRNGIAIVGIEDKFGLLNVTGSLYTGLQYDQFFFLSDSILAARLGNNWGTTDFRGQPVSGFKFDALGAMKCNRALFAIKSKCGFINEYGRVEIPAVFQYNESMLESTQYTSGFILLKQRNKRVLITDKGDRINLSAYDEIGLPGDSLIPVRKLQKWGFADRSGKLVIPCIYQQVTGDVNGAAIVKPAGKKFGAIGIKGEWILNPEYEQITVNLNYFQVVKDGRKGLITITGKVIIPASCDVIEILNDDFIELTKDNRKCYYNLKANKIIWD